MDDFKVALVQQKAAANDPAENLERGLCLAERAKEMGADIVLFPELWSNGYAPPFEGAFERPLDARFETERRRWLDAATDESGGFITAFRQAARRLQIGVVATYLSKGNAAPRNTATVIGREGNILMTYSKVHTCDFSLERLLESGEAFRVCDFEGVCLGVMICFDREFPESARVLMLKGAELILVPNACDMNPARLNQLSTRAFENMTGVAMANYPEKGWGRSCAYSPVVFGENGCYRDNRLVMAGETDEDIFLAVFPMAEIRAYRRTEPWGSACRKTAAYGALLGAAVENPFR